MALRDELLSLVDADDGMIHAERAVDWAQGNPDSELHAKLQWDDAKAAHQHRLDQVRQLIEIHVVFPTTGHRATVSLTMDRSQGGGYRPLLPVLGNRQLREMLIRQILDELERVAARYPQLDEIAPLRDAIRQQQRMLELPMAAD